MRRNFFFWSTLGFSLTLAVAFSIAPVAANAEKTRKKPAVEEKTTAQQAGASGGQQEVVGGLGPAAGISPGQIDARSAILVEVSAGTVLYEQNADELIPPASFTKIATLYLIFQALRQGRIHLNDQVFISRAAWRTGGSKMFVRVGTRVSLEDIIEGIAVVSGNDACVAAAEHLSGSVATFVNAMNREAKKLGMTRTVFLTPDGLPVDGQVTTARDMATLDMAFIKTFPEALKYTAMKEFTFNDIRQYNRNRLLFEDPSVDGLKTGYVAAGGYHLAATADRDGMRLLAIVMGAKSPRIRAREARKLLNYGFRNFTLVHAFPKGKPVATVNVWKGQKDEVQIYPVQSASFLIPRSKKKLLKWEVHAPSDVTAPIKAGQKMGDLVFLVSGQEKRTVALVSRENIPQGGLFKRSWQTVDMSLRTLDWKWLSSIVGGIAILAIILILLAGRKSQRRFGR